MAGPRSELLLVKQVGGQLEFLEKIEAWLPRCGPFVDSHPHCGEDSPHTGTTSFTSGISSRSLFSIPILSVSTKDGHPLQEPRMLRYPIPSSKWSRESSPPSSLADAQHSPS